MKELKMAILKDLIRQMQKKEGSKGDKSPMDIEKLNPAEAMMEAAEGEAPEAGEADELKEMLQQFLKGDAKLPEASGVTIEVVSEGSMPKPMAKEMSKKMEEAHKGTSVPVEGTKQMLKEFLKSKKLQKFG